MSSVNVQHRTAFRNRRAVLQTGSVGLLGLTMPALFAAETNRSDKWPARAKSVIFLYQFGGPSHGDTLDMKPLAPDGIRSQFGQIETSLPGLRICEHLPKTAIVMHQVTLLRTVHHGMKNHNSAAYHALTGHAPPVDDIRLKDSIELFPAYGSVVDHLAPRSETLPGPRRPGGPGPR